MNIEQMKSIKDDLLTLLDTVYKFKNELTYSYNAKTIDRNDIDLLINDFSILNHIDFSLNDLLQFIDNDITERSV